MKIKITDEEAATVGVYKDSTGDGPDGWGAKIRPLLIAKGVPEEYLEIGSMKCVPVQRDIDGVIFLVSE